MSKIENFVIEHRARIFWEPDSIPSSLVVDRNTFLAEGSSKDNFVPTFWPRSFILNLPTNHKVNHGERAFWGTKLLSEPQTLQAKFLF